MSICITQTCQKQAEGENYLGFCYPCHNRLAMEEWLEEFGEDEPIIFTPAPEGDDDLPF